MRQLICIVLIIGIAREVFPQEPLHHKVFFSNSPMEGNYFYSKATYQSPSWVKNNQGKLPVSENSFTPANSLELSYVSGVEGSWQARVMYHPIRGIDLFKPASHLVFWLFVESETSPNELPLVGISNREDEPETMLKFGDYIENYQKSKWLKLAVPLEDLGVPQNIDDLNTITFSQQNSDGKAHWLYIDQIELLSTDIVEPIDVAPKLNSAQGYLKHVDIAWDPLPINDDAVKYVKIYRSTDKKEYRAVGIQFPKINRYADYTGETGVKYTYKISFLNHKYEESPRSNTVTAATTNMTDTELLDMVQLANFRYYWEGAEANSGLSLENIPGRQNMVASGASGFGIMALIVGTERKFIARQEAVERFLKITSFLETAEKFHGAFSHFIDGPSGRVEPFFGPRDNGGDLVETSFLVQGLLAAQQYFDRNNKEEKLIRDRIQKIWEGVEWEWYRRDPDSKFLFWHWSPDQEWIIDHKLIGWNETMITYLLGIASPTHPIPASMYYTGWASQSEEAQKYRRNWGKTSDGDHYINGNTYYGIPLQVGVSSGGPLFFIHYSYLGPDPRQIQDAYTDYFSNNRNIALINYRYCLENPKNYLGYGENCWGLTASDGPMHYSANEPTLNADEGKMTPTGALASFPYTPQESMAALKNYYLNYGKFLWGAYGFKDAFSLNENWCSGIYMGLNQAPIVVMIENYRTGLIWNLFMKNEDIKNALMRLKIEGIPTD